MWGRAKSDPWIRRVPMLALNLAAHPIDDPIADIAEIGERRTEVIETSFFAGPKTTPAAFV